MTAARDFLSQGEIGRPLQRFSLQGACFFRRVKVHGERAMKCFSQSSGDPSAMARRRKCRYSCIEMACNVRYVLVLPSPSTHVYPLKQASKCVAQSAPRNKPSLLYIKESRKSY
ncbi:hypothetical protein [Paraburkholderia xenovorans]|uniref:hypothetical protein n=1 Tax=Paraburkholderia xenovorans TaxID=36873 RepID=UPI0038BD19EE